MKSGRRDLTPVLPVEDRALYAALAFAVLAVAGGLAAGVGFAAYLGGEWLWQGLYDGGHLRFSPDVLEMVQGVPALVTFLPYALAFWPVMAMAFFGAIAVLLRGRLSAVEAAAAAAAAAAYFVYNSVGLGRALEAEIRWEPVLPLWSVPVGGSVLLAASAVIASRVFTRLAAGRAGRPV